MVAGELCLILETNVGCLQATDCYQSNAYFLCMNNDMLSEKVINNEFQQSFDQKCLSTNDCIQNVGLDCNINLCQCKTQNFWNGSVCSK
jgi:hypothetical protein